MSITHSRLRPGPTNPRGSFRATVKSNERLCTDHYRLTLAVPHFPPSNPGQFLQIDCRDPSAAPTADSPREFDWIPASKPHSPFDPDFRSPLAYLRRPFSIADHRTLPDGSSEIDIIHRAVGKGTVFLAHLQLGQSISLLGPLGNGFDIPEGAGLQLACLIGGGVGIPPMLYLAKRMRQRNIQNALGFVGALRSNLLPVTLTNTPPDPHGTPTLSVAEFAQAGYRSIVTTDDGSLGMKGFVTAALDHFLESQTSLSNTIVYCCGPTPMMKATAKVAAKYNILCQVSLEQPMACGMATCQSCIIKFRPHDAPEGTDWKYKLTCTEGPVFDARDILW